MIETEEKTILQVKDVAKRWGTTAERVLRLIRAKHLTAFNIAHEKAGRPTWRIRLSDLVDFEEGRRNSSPPKPFQRRRRRKK